LGLRIGGVFSGAEALLYFVGFFRGLKPSGPSGKRFRRG
jgi:hypothetical protein